MPFFRHDAHRLHYDEYGTGEEATVLLPGMLFSSRMQEPLARALARPGRRVVTLDLLGHGRSDQPPDMWRYSMSLFAEQVVALLDHLEIPEAVVGGASLGANTTLEVASLAPERLRGMIVEMPVLDNALLACAMAFTPLMVGLTFGARGARLVARVAGAVPRSALPPVADAMLEVLARDPGPSAAVVQGLFFGRVAPHRTERRTFTAPALVIGHDRDPVHPFSDAGMLAEELPNARLLHASSILELRTRPERLTGEIVSFLDECWGPRPAARARPRRTRARAASVRA